MSDALSQVGVALGRALDGVGGVVGAGAMRVDRTKAVMAVHNGCTYHFAPRSMPDALCGEPSLL